MQRRCSEVQQLVLSNNINISHFIIHRYMYMYLTSFTSLGCEWQSKWTLSHSKCSHLALIDIEWMQWSNLNGCFLCPQCEYPSSVDLSHPHNVVVDNAIDVDSFRWLPAQCNQSGCGIYPTGSGVAGWGCRSYKICIVE